jgi:DNA-directed RNA polymerase specialized sigma54-like protein
VSTNGDQAEPAGTGEKVQASTTTAFARLLRADIPEAPMNVSEKTMARHLIPTLPGAGYLVGDPEYDANPLYDLAAEAGFQLVAKKRRDRGRGGLLVIHKELAVLRNRDVSPFFVF